mmetsp:Transcript_48425/g.58427  ORF Transcript_48425/g.58427 Transcript_48425/m.58427 type:complete len:133 (-) Transcript_48425:221-619(-)|eukprot:CAMPEP_0194360646 /NCGR_PEP_ID=MMETSP0174-20130528/8005_1 /TAXON_ID=216777 /ORGANISM="Proboscia alata, Strain PI-D3" /LENGTH=132 /DNA_ID=CAMNT_0039132255 /DNA_START=60 /DNA_END=458 /DNA_ORIENTATION=-
MEMQKTTSSYNIMFDSRVVRGNTYASPVITENERRSFEVYEKNKLSRAKAKSTEEISAQQRIHMETQTHEYLEELRDRPIEVENETQTDESGRSSEMLLPIFIPAKVGEDKGVQASLEQNEQSDEEEKSCSK